MRVRLELASPRSGEWYVTVDGTYLVGFTGLHARELAVQQQRELTQLLATSPPATTDVAGRESPAIVDERVKKTTYGRW